MTLTRVNTGIQDFPDFAKNQQMANAQIYVGVPGLDPTVLANQYQLYVVQENGTEVAIPQPVRTSAGGVPTYNGSPVKVAVSQTSYSLKVLNSLGAQVYYNPQSNNLFLVNSGQISYGGAGPGGVTVSLENIINKKVTTVEYGIPGNLTDDGQNHIRLMNAAKAAVKAGCALEIIGKILYSDTVNFNTTTADYNNLDPNIPNGVAKYLPIVSSSSSSGLYAKASAFSGLNKSCIIYESQEAMIMGNTFRMYNDGAFNYTTMYNIKLLQVNRSDRTPIVFNSIGGILEQNGGVSVGPGTCLWLNDCMSPTVEHNFIVYYTNYGICRDNGTTLNPIASLPVRVSTSGSFIKNYFGGGNPAAISRNQCVSINTGYGDSLIQNVFENNSPGRAIYSDIDNIKFLNNWHEGTYDTVLFGGGFGCRWDGAINLQALVTNCCIEGLYTYSIPGSLPIGVPNPVAMENLDIKNNGFYFTGDLVGARITAKKGVYTRAITYDGNKIEADINTNILTQTSGTGVCLTNKLAPNPTHTLAHVIKSRATTDGSGVLILENDNAVNGTSIFVAVGGAGVGYNSANCVLGVFRSSVSGRSINAAGTINASGADYAEYMRKSYKFDLKKGDIAGIDKNGLLTLKYKDAIAFLVKSTDPCIVGGDAWGTEDALGIKKPIPPTDENSKDFKAKFQKYEEELADFNRTYEEARSWYDRMAFCGRCPANAYGANVGDYLLPIEKNGSVAFDAVSEKELNFEQYKKALGKVIKILDDGRAEMIIKAI